MIFFVVFLRFLAACLITNAHYTGGIYPTELIANGGLLGDVIFFAVSGYCLYNIKHWFPRWYGKRLVRCYIPVLIVTAIYCLFGLYSFKEHNPFWWFVYPTNYHFVASIILLYIPFYVIIKVRFFREKLPIVAGVVLLAHLIVYIFAYDKSYYHIDSVREPMIWFLFMEAMLIGAWFRQKDGIIRNNFHWYFPIFLIVLLGLYFGSKIVFSKTESLSHFQIVNQFVLLLVLFSILLLFSSLDSRLERMPARIKKAIMFISEMTLEIYVVQYAIIDSLRPLYAGYFPQSWFALTITILVAATLLHFVCKGVLHVSDLIVSKIRIRTIKQ